MKSTESQPSLSIAMPSLQNKWLWCSLTPSEQNKTEFNNRHSLLLAPKYSWKWPYVASTVYLLQYLKFTAVFEKQILLFFRYDEANRSGNDLHWGKKNSLSFTVPNRKEWSCQSEWLLSKSLQAINDGEGVEKREPSYIVGGDANCLIFKIALLSVSFLHSVHPSIFWFFLLWIPPFLFYVL